MAEREGFEPSMELSPHTRLAGERLQPTRPSLRRNICVMGKPLFVYSMLFGYITGLLVLVKESGTKSRQLRAGFEKNRATGSACWPTGFLCQIRRNGPGREPGRENDGLNKAACLCQDISPLIGRIKIQIENPTEGKQDNRVMRPKQVDKNRGAGLPK